MVPDWVSKIGVAYAWLVDLEARALTAQRRESGRWVTPVPEGQSSAPSTAMHSS
jgi:hypothetical protein